MYRRSRAGQIVDLVDRTVRTIRGRNILFRHLEIRIGGQVLDVLRRSGEKIIQADNLTTFVEQSNAQMRSDKACASRNQYSFHKNRANLNCLKSLHCMVDPDGAPEQAGRNGRMNVRIDDKVIIFSSV